MVETLIQNKANIHVVDQKGRTALMFALEQKSKHIVEMLLQSGIDVSAADNFGQMALAYAIASGDTSLKKLILQYMKLESKHPENINPGFLIKLILMIIVSPWMRPTINIRTRISPKTMENYLTLLMNRRMMKKQMKLRNPNLKPYLKTVMLILKIKL
ncbi:ankyrin repeat domain-containing protein 34B-like [Marmota marmota marmota]|uniref:ankyrin repeat domain-containing protein 34B-like n=1 Tax=Marmota marmota marmota TaxID=9994 RepID=UPI002093891F|nr:ankyrin repeat domain-containing protein 34B-like [Marmota marmota marmota]